MNCERCIAYQIARSAEGSHQAYAISHKALVFCQSLRD